MQSSCNAACVCMERPALGMISTCSCSSVLSSACTTSALCTPSPDSSPCNTHAEMGFPASHCRMPAGHGSWRHLLYLNHTVAQGSCKSIAPQDEDSTGMAVRWDRPKRHAVAACSCLSCNPVFIATCQAPHVMHMRTHPNLDQAFETPYAGPLIRVCEANLT